MQWIACAGAADLVRHQRADLGQHGTRDNSSASRQLVPHRRDGNVCHRSGRRITQRRLQPALLGQRNNSTLSRSLGRPGAVPLALPCLGPSGPTLSQPLATAVSCANPRTEDTIGPQSVTPPHQGDMHDPLPHTHARHAVSGLDTKPASMVISNMRMRSWEQHAMSH